jgi:hypothetical protein
VLPVEKGAGFRGGVWQLTDAGAGRFEVEVATPMQLANVGLSLFQVTTDVNGLVIDARKTPMFGQSSPPFEFGALDIDLQVPGQTVTIVSAAGYNRWRNFSDLESSQTCHQGAGCAADRFQTAAATLTSDVQCAPLPSACRPSLSGRPRRRARTASARR